MTNIIISIIYGITLGIALSIDAFMFSLVYGSTIKNRREGLLTGFIVGLFHLVLPLIGYFLASFIFTHINLVKFLENKLQFFAFIILSIIGIMMINKKEEEKQYNISFLFQKCLFALSVSIDSFLTGIALTTINHIIIFIVVLVFAFVSCISTLIALRIGKRTSHKLINSNLNIYAGVLIIVLAIISLFI